VLGLQAREIHVCGGLEAEQVVRSLAESAGDDFELVEYKRLSTLE
jgi:ATP-dependent RNA helicase SUPV3L1/SUV3